MYRIKMTLSFSRNKGIKKGINPIMIYAFIFEESFL
jgi:hypothetical protein